MADTVQIVASPNFVVVINHEMDGNAAGFNVNVNNTGFSVVAGIMQAAESIGGIEYTQNEKDKLAAIEATATTDQSGSEIKVLYEGEPNAFTDTLFTKLDGMNANATDDQTGAEIKALYEQRSMAFTDAQWTKLATIEASAKDDQTGAEIKTAYELEADTNAFDDAAVSKLAGIEASAEVNPTDADIRTAVGNADDSNVFTDTDHAKLDGIEAADNTWTGANDFQNTFALSGELQPPEITANQHNYAPTGIGDVSYLRILSDAAWDITGIAGGFAGRILTITNVGVNAITLADESANSTVANRFDFSFGDHIILAGESITIRYDGTENQWHSTQDAAPLTMSDAAIRTAVEAASDSNVFTDNDHSKLDAIEASATIDQTDAEIRTAVAAATDSNVYDDAAVSKLAAIEASATADQTNAEIRTAVEAATDSNVFDDADHTKLNGIEASATIDQTDADIRAAVAAATDSNVYDDAAVSKLAAIEASATADQTNAEIRTAVGAATDSNVFQDADASKLDGIETDATADQSNSEIATAYGVVVAKISSQEIIDGDEVTVRRFSPEDMEAMIAVHTATPFNTQSGTAYTLAMSDADGIVEMESADANEVTIPLNEDVAYPIGTVISVSMMGVGVTSVSAAYGVTLNGIIDGQIVMVAQFDAVSMYKRATDEWVIQGGGSLLSNWWATLTVDGIVPGVVAQFGRIEGGRYMADGASKTLGEILVFTRASDGTFYNAAGVQQTGGTDGERMEHNPATGEILGLLQENSATNLVTKSTELDHVNWVKEHSSVSANTGVAPNGATEMDKLVEANDTNQIHSIAKNVTVVDTKKYAVSIFARAAGRNKIFIRRDIADNMPAPSTHHFDLVTGVTSGSNWDALYIEDVSNGIFRCTAVFTATGSGTARPSFGLLADADPADTSYDGDGSSGVEFWGAHIEEIPAVFEPGSFIKTTDATATRVRDVITMTPDGGDPHPGYHATDNTVVVEFMIPKSPTGNQQIIAYGLDVGNRISLYYTSGTIMMYAQLASSTQANISIGTVSTGVWNKVSLQWNADDIRGSVNGANAVSITGISFPTPTELLFGVKTAGGNYMHNILWRGFRQYPSYLSQASLEALSAP